MNSEQLLEKVQLKICELAQKGQAYTSLNTVPYGKALQRAAERENKTVHQRYLFGGLRFINF